VSLAEYVEVDRAPSRALLVRMGSSAHVQDTRQYAITSHAITVKAMLGARDISSRGLHGMADSFMKASVGIRREDCL